ncbi:MAG: helical backbone metal receptor [Flavobacteriales bacterium]|nr:helical backbone metal receptor [Flavobacteriales bacterium]
MKILDQVGRELHLKDAPKRVVSLVPSITELLFDLGFEVVGRTKFCVHPKSIEECAIIGGTKNVNINKVVSLNPDLVVANKEENRQEAVDELSRAGLPVYVSDISNVTESLYLTTELGKVGAAENAAKLINENIKNIFQKCREHKSLRILYFIWKKPYMVAGTDTFISDVLTKLNLENCIKSSRTDSLRYPKITTEQISHLKPDVILLSSEPYPFKEIHAKELTKQTGIPVVLVNGECFSWYGSRLSKSLDYLVNFSRLLRDEIES